MVKTMTISKFKEKLDNTPHLMTPQTFLSVVDAVSKEATPEMLKIFSDNQEVDPEDLIYNPDTGVGVIDICGALTYQSEWWQYWEGGTSYERIQEEATMLAEMGMKTLAITMDSGGGAAYAMIETAQYLRKLADEYGFKVLVYVDGSACSAAYGIASIADEIIANPMADVGSIGVVVRLRNVNEAMKNAGVIDTYIYYGTQKIPYDKNGAWKKEFIDGVQANVDALGEEFTSFVAINRRMTVEAVKSTEAATYLAKDALDIGLIDSVMTHEEFYTYLADFVQKEKYPMSIKDRLFNLTSEQEKIEMKELEAVQLELSTLKATLETEGVAKAALDSQVATLKASLEETKTKLSAFEAVAAQLEADKEATVKAQAEAKVLSRKTTLAAVLPVDKIEAAMAVLADVPETVFEFAVAGYKVQEDKKNKSALFQEIGSEGAKADEVFDPAKAQAEYNKKHFNK